MEVVGSSLILLVEADLSAARCFTKRHQTPADLDPPNVGIGVGVGVGVRVGLRQGSGWSGPTCKVEFDLPRPAQVVCRPLLHIGYSRYTNAPSEAKKLSHVDFLEAKNPTPHAS